MPDTSVRLKWESACAFAQRIVPEYAAVLVDLIKGGGWFRFRPGFVSYLSSIGSYVRLYERDGSLGVALFAGLVGVEEFKLLSAKAEAWDIDELVQFLGQLEGGICEADFFSEIALPKSEKEWADARRRLASMNDEEKEAIQVQMALFFGGAFGGFFNCLSLMVHGEGLTSLVPQAIGGNASAFLKAVQIDRLLLLHHPYFRGRKQAAQDEGEAEFLRSLAAVEAGSPVRGRIKYPALYLLFGVLEVFGWLDEVSHSEILDLCDRSRLDRFQGRIDDVNSVTKMLSQYRARQKRGRLSMQ